MEFDNIPEGWRVLWCSHCLMSLLFTDDIAMQIWEKDEEWLTWFDQLQAFFNDPDIHNMSLSHKVGD